MKRMLNRFVKFSTINDKYANKNPWNDDNLYLQQDPKQNNTTIQYNTHTHREEYSIEVGVCVCVEAILVWINWGKNDDIEIVMLFKNLINIFNAELWSKLFKR